MLSNRYVGQRHVHVLIVLFVLWMDPIHTQDYADNEVLPVDAAPPRMKPALTTTTKILPTPPARTSSSSGMAWNTHELLRIHVQVPRDQMRCLVGSRAGDTEHRSGSSSTDGSSTIPHYCDDRLSIKVHDLEDSSRILYHESVTMSSPEKGPYETSQPRPDHSDQQKQEQRPPNTDYETITSITLLIPTPSSESSITTSDNQNNRDTSMEHHPSIPDSRMYIVSLWKELDDANRTTTTMTNISISSFSSTTNVPTTTHVMITRRLAIFPQGRRRRRTRRVTSTPIGTSMTDNQLPSQVVHVELIYEPCIHYLESTVDSKPTTVNTTSSTQPFLSPSNISELQDQPSENHHQYAQQNEHDKTSSRISWFEQVVLIYLMGGGLFSYINRVRSISQQQERAAIGEYTTFRTTTLHHAGLVVHPVNLENSQQCEEGGEREADDNFDDDNDHDEEESSSHDNVMDGEEDDMSDTESTQFQRRPLDRRELLQIRDLLRRATTTQTRDDVDEESSLRRTTTTASRDNTAEVEDNHCLQYQSNREKTTTIMRDPVSEFPSIIERQARRIEPLSRLPDPLMVAQQSWARLLADTHRMSGDPNLPDHVRELLALAARQEEEDEIPPSPWWNDKSEWPPRDQPIRRYHAPQSTGDENGDAEKIPFDHSNGLIRGIQYHDPLNPTTTATTTVTHDIGELVPPEPVAATWRSMPLSDTNEAFVGEDACRPLTPSKNSFSTQGETNEVMLAQTIENLDGDTLLDNNCNSGTLMKSHDTPIQTVQTVDDNEERVIFESSAKTDDNEEGSEAVSTIPLKHGMSCPESRAAPQIHVSAVDLSLHECMNVYEIVDDCDNFPSTETENGCPHQPSASQTETEFERPNETLLDDQGMKDTIDHTVTMTRSGSLPQTHGTEDDQTCNTHRLEARADQTEVHREVLVSAADANTAKPLLSALENDNGIMPQSSRQLQSRSQAEKTSVVDRNDHGPLPDRTGPTLGHDETSMTYVSTLPPDSDYISDDVATHSMPEIKVSVGDGDASSNKDLPRTRRIEEASRTPGIECELPPKRTRRKGGRKSRLSRVVLTDDGMPRESASGSPVTECDSSAVEVVKVVQPPESFLTNKRKTRPFSDSHVVPDWVPSKRLQVAAHAFTEDASFTMASHPTSTKVVDYPKAIHLRPRAGRNKGNVRGGEIGGS